MNYKYFTYLHIRIDTNKIFYIGKGTINNCISEKCKYKRAYSKASRNVYWKTIVKNVKYKIIIDELFENEIDCLTKEEYLILYYGTRKNNGILTNFNISDNPSEHYSFKIRNAIPKVKVYKYDEKGLFLNEYDSITEAALLNNCNITDICVAIGNVKNRRRLFVNNYIWSKHKYDKIAIPINNCVKENVIYQFDKHYNFIKKWFYVKDILKNLNINHGSLRNNLCNISKSAGGFIFKYENQIKTNLVRETNKKQKKNEKS